MAPDVLLTPRLRLRFHEPADAPFMMELNADPEVVRYTGNTAFASEADARAVIDGLMKQAQERLGRMIVLDRNTGERLGWCGLKRLDEGPIDLGYRFFRRHWGKGFATEAARASVSFGFGELGLAEIVAHVMVGNDASARVLDKLGFRETSAVTMEGHAARAFILSRV